MNRKQRNYRTIFAEQLWSEFFETGNCRGYFDTTDHNLIDLGEEYGEEWHVGVSQDLEWRLLMRKQFQREKSNT
jgi:hypothetical protein